MLCFDSPPELRSTSVLLRSEDQAAVQGVLTRSLEHQIQFS